MSILPTRDWQVKEIYLLSMPTNFRSIQKQPMLHAIEVQQQCNLDLQNHSVLGIAMPASQSQQRHPLEDEYLYKKFSKRQEEGWAKKEQYSLHRAAEP